MLRRAIGEVGGVLVNLSHGMADLVSYGNVERDIEQVLSSFSFKYKILFFFLRYRNPKTSSLAVSDLHKSPFLYLLQALIALKKGTQLLKYGRKGKPKFCPFRLSNVSVLWITCIFIWVRS